MCVFRDEASMLTQKNRRQIKFLVVSHPIAPKPTMPITILERSGETARFPNILTTDAPRKKLTPRVILIAKARTNSATDFSLQPECLLTKDCPVA